MFPSFYVEPTEKIAHKAGDKVAYLTFDDGPSELTPQVLKILADNDVKATFFVVGRSDAQSKKWMKEIVDQGHTIGMHTYTHNYKKIYASPTAFFTDLSELNDLITEATGVKPQIVRFAGGKITQETLRYNESDGTTSSMRNKEDADDYRYFRDPDLVNIHVTDEEVEAIRRALPELPEVKRERYISQFGLPEADALQLTKSRAIAEFFEAASDGVKNPKTVANCIIGQIFRRMENDDAKEKFEVSIPASYLKDLVLLLDSGKIRMNLLKSTLDQMLDSGKPATEFLSESDLSGVDTGDLKKFCEDAVAANPNAVADYRAGKEKALKALLGSVMKASRGRADALEVERILIELIS